MIWLSVCHAEFTINVFIKHMEIIHKSLLIFVFPQTTSVLEYEKILYVQWLCSLNFWLDGQPIKQTIIL